MGRRRAFLVRVRVLHQTVGTIVRSTVRSTVRFLGRSVSLEPHFWHGPSRIPICRPNLD